RVGRDEPLRHARVHEVARRDLAVHTGAAPVEPRGVPARTAPVVPREVVHLLDPPWQAELGVRTQQAVQEGGAGLEGADAHEGWQPAGLRRAQGRRPSVAGMATIGPTAGCFVAAAGRSTCRPRRGPGRRPRTWTRPATFAPA